LLIGTGSDSQIRVPNLSPKASEIFNPIPETEGLHST
jgi:hypothetical protein